MKLNNNASTIFTVLIVSFPFLSLYWSGISTLSIADVLLICFVVLYIMRGGGGVYNNIWIVFFIYLVIHYGISCITAKNIESIDGFIFLRYALYIFSATFLFPKRFNLEFGIECIRQIGKFITIFCIIQAVFLYGFGYYIKGAIPFLALMRDDPINYTYLRVRGIFGEPAHLAEYMTLVLITFLLTIGKHNKFWALCATMSVLLSTSGTGIVMVSVVWILYSYSIFRNRFTFKSLWAFTIVIMGLLLVLSFYSSLSIYSFSSQRFHSAYHGRVDVYSIMTQLWSSLDLLQVFIGHSYIRMSSELFMPSYFVIFWRYGITGVLMLCILLVRCYFRCNSAYQKLILISLLVLFVGTEIFISPRILVYLPFISKKREFLYDWNNTQN